MPKRPPLENRVRDLEKQVRNLLATQELLYEMISTQTVMQAKLAMEAQRLLDDPSIPSHMDVADTDEQSTDA
jgi:hypothetical protein